MKDPEIDEILKKAGQTPSKVDPALLDRIAAAIGPSMRPVRPIPPAWALVGSVIFATAAVALAGAARAGFYGVENLSGLERALIFPAVAIFIWLAASTCVNEMIPGSRITVQPGTLLAAGSVALIAVFAILFHDYRTDGFLPEGIACLVAGLLHAIPTGLLIWLILRRGFAVNSVAAGLAAGTLAGLAGITMLELHCPNFKALHIIVWHTAVVPVSGAAGAFLAWALRFRDGADGRKGPNPV